MKKVITIARSCKNIVGVELFLIEGNREINWEHVKSIKKAMMAGANFPPLEVDAVENYIIDGQHRYEAAKQLWEEGIEYQLLVHYYNSNNPLLDAINFNNTQISWTLEDYINAYIASENINYYMFKEWVKSKPLLKSGNPTVPYRYESAVIMLGEQRCHLKDGSLIFPDDTKMADMLYNEIASFKDSRIFLKSYVRAWMNVRAHCLYDMSFSTYYELWKSRFVFPEDQKIEEIEKAFKRVIM